MLFAKDSRGYLAFSALHCVTIITVHRCQRVQTQEPSSRTEVILHFGRIMTSCCRFGGINRKNYEQKQDWKDLLQEGRKEGKKLPAQEV
jgi:hypothetical protein